MSDLKHLTEEQLEIAKTNTEEYIQILERDIDRLIRKLMYKKSTLSGQNVRLDWIIKYLKDRRK